MYQSIKTALTENLNQIFNSLARFKTNLTIGFSTFPLSRISDFNSSKDIHLHINMNCLFLTHTDFFRAFIYLLEFSISIKVFLILAYKFSQAELVHCNELFPNCRNVFSKAVRKSLPRQTVIGCCKRKTTLTETQTYNPQVFVQSLLDSLQNELKPFSVPYFVTKLLVHLVCSLSS